MVKFDAVHHAHAAIKRVLNKDMVALDATAGNGYDTLFLAKQSRLVYAFDIQALAIKNVQQRLREANINNVKLIHDTHANIDNYVKEPIMAAMFNLGYLPGSDKTVITEPPSTIKALEVVFKKLLGGGVVTVVCYQGHRGGREELKAVQAYLEALDHALYELKTYKSFEYHEAPITFVITKN